MLFAAAAMVAVWAGGRDDGPRRIIAGAAAPVAPVALPGGDFLYAERTTGRVLQVTDGAAHVVATVPDRLRTDGQRGLLGLAVRSTGAGIEIFGAWTRMSDGRLVVGRLDDVEAPAVWEGPVSTDLANGGTLVFRGDELLIGVGELQDPAAALDPTTANGKVLALDPAGPPDQTPTVVRGGWHNPFALTVAGGDVWVVDNAPGSEPERLARIAPDGSASVVDLTGKRAPSSLAVLPDGDLALCGYVSQVVERIPVPDRGVAPPDGEIGPPCATGVAVLPDGSMVTTTADAIWRDPDPH